jgi:hypothetical protein
VTLLYATLAIAGLLLTGLTLLGIGLLFEHVLDFAAKVMEDRAREFANARDFGDIPAIHTELRTSQRKGAHRASAGPSGTYPTQVFLPSIRVLVRGERKYNG